MLWHQNIANNEKLHFCAQLAEGTNELSFEPLRIKQSCPTVGAGRQIVEVVTLIVVMLSRHVWPS
jgi:hypothetical protein